MSSFKTISAFSGSEQKPADSVTLSATGLSPEIQLYPTSMSSAIEGIRFLITVNVTNGATAITSGTVGGFIALLEIKQGVKSLLRISNMKQLQDFFHIKTGQVLSDVNIPTTASTVDSASLEFVLPYKIMLGEQVTVNLQFNGYNSAIVGGSVTGATGSMGLSFYYSNAPVGNTEAWEVGQTPTALAASTDVNLGSYLGNAKPIYELYSDVTSDANLNYYKFEIGTTTVFYDYPFDLIQYEVQEPQYSHISGLFRLPIDSGIVINTGSNSQAKAVINLSTSEQITLFARTQ